MQACSLCRSPHTSLIIITTHINIRSQWFKLLPMSYRCLSSVLRHNFTVAKKNTHTHSHNHFYNNLFIEITVIFTYYKEKHKRTFFDYFDSREVTRVLARKRVTDQRHSVCAARAQLNLMCSNFVTSP